MNSDGITNREPDRTSSAQPPEIIDVQVVEEILVVPEPLADIWASEEVVDLPPPLPQPPMPDLAQPEITSTIETAALPENPPTPEDNWDILLNEISQDLEPELETIGGDNLKVEPLLRKEAAIKAEIAKLQATKAKLQQQIDDTQTSIGQIVQTSIADLEQRRQKLQISVEQLERRRDRIEKEINKSFAGASQDIAIRLQGFKDYLVGSLQDLVVIAEEIEFPQPPPAQIRIQTPVIDKASVIPATTTRNQSPQFTEPAFKSTASKVRASIDRYRTAPDYYAPTWQLRRTLEPVHADKVAEWFFAKDGRGAVRTMGSRLQNILVAATAVSVLRELYGDYLRTLVLANLPERLGDWRRGFQDCLGLSKADFGGNGGIILFEDPEALVQKVDRIVANKEMPLIIIDNSEGQISLSILQYPLWLAFAPDPNQQVDDYREYR